MNTIFEKKYEVSTFLTNVQGKLGLYFLLNILQDIASDHAEELGFGYQDMLRMKLFWVLTRQNLSMTHWPRWKDEILVKTWIREGEGAASFRDFSIHLNDKVIGNCSTSWVTLNSETRRPVAFDRKILFPQMSAGPQDYLETRKISPLEVGKKVLSFHVRNSDIDMNYHVNNTKYSQWILDSIPLETQKRHILSSYEVNFIAETRPEDLISIWECPQETTGQGLSTQFQGLREKDNKIVFTSRIGYFEA